MKPMNPAHEALLKLFERDLDVLRREIDQYQDQQTCWQIVPGTSNSGGNLCLHLCGNLQHYIGHLLGNITYTRDRPYEFAAKDLPLEFLQSEIAKARHAVLHTLQNLPSEDFDKLYPTEELGYPMTTAHFLIHLSGHLKYHTGQINYHRRILQQTR